MSDMGSMRLLLSTLISGRELYSSVFYSFWLFICCTSNEFVFAISAFVGCDFVFSIDDVNGELAVSPGPVKSLFVCIVEAM